MYDLFISYTQEDGDIAASLASRLDEAGVKCFMADKSILAAAEWGPVLREALRCSSIILTLITPRSKDSLWVAAEAGAAWALAKPLIPALMFVQPRDLFEPIRGYQARIVETPEQREMLVGEIGRLVKPVIEDHTVFPKQTGETFGNSETWNQLLKVGQWTREEDTGAIVGGGLYRYLLSHQSYGPGPFSIDCRMTFLKLRPESADRAVNAGFVLGWVTPNNARQYYHLAFSGTHLFLEQIGFRRGDEYVDFEHVSPEVPFELEPNKKYDFHLIVTPQEVVLLSDKKQIYSIAIPTNSIRGRVGIRPWRSLLRCELFEINVPGDSQLS